MEGGEKTVHDEGSKETVHDRMCRQDSTMEGSKETGGDSTR